ncbi:MAG TPA: MarR family transcriptional regulator [Thermoplasmata archaeon]|nr:MarR family transcriptional regulator [Thermoplasmata archaeon]
MVASSALASTETRPENAEMLVTSVHEVLRSVLRRVHPTLDAEGISMGQFWALHLVSSLGSTSVSAVARHLSLSAPTVCANIDQLEAARLVARHRSQRDRRAVELTLTPKGRRVEARVWARIGEVMTEAIAEAGLPPNDIATTVRVFRELDRQLQTGETPGGAVP